MGMKSPMKYACFTLLCLASFISIDARQLFQKRNDQSTNVKGNIQNFCSFDGDMFYSNTNTYFYNQNRYGCKESYAFMYDYNYRSITVQLTDIYIDCNRGDIEFWDGNGRTVFYCQTNRAQSYTFTTNALYVVIARHGIVFARASIRFDTSPVTVAPVTVAPVTVAPVTVAPVTVAPVTVAPVTVAPITVAPSSGCGIPAITPRDYNPDSKIVGGVDARPGSWPWMASLSGFSHFCGGSLINDQWILTAAHCKTSISQFTVKLGDYYSNGIDQTEVTYNPSEWISHPDYNDNSLSNDIALIKLSRKVTYNDRIRPVCLPNGRTPVIGTTGTVTGWGLTDKNGEGDISATLKQVNIPINNPTACTNSPIPSSQFCAGDTNLQNPLDSCQGDSGGPFVVKSGNSYYQMGIVSYGYLCTGGGVYTNVNSYESWIANTIANN